MFVDLDAVVFSFILYFSNTFCFHVTIFVKYYQTELRIGLQVITALCRYVVIILFIICFTQTF